MTIAFHRAIPVFRSHSLEKARALPGDVLGCKVDGQHRCEPEAVALMRGSRDGLTVYLGGDHGAGTPGAVAFVCRELNVKKYGYNPPSPSRPRGRPHETALLNA